MKRAFAGLTTGSVLAIFGTVALLASAAVGVANGESAGGSSALFFSWLRAAGGLLRDAIERYLCAQLFLSLAALVLIMTIEKAADALGLMSAVKRIAAQRAKAALALLPAVVGLLPAIAGAQASLKLVERIGSGFAASPARLAAVNFWFRHVHVFCNPLISGTILALGICGLSAGEVLRWGVPAALVFFFAGWLALIRPLSQKEIESAALHSSGSAAAAAGESAQSGSSRNPAAKVFAALLFAATLAAFVTSIPLALLLLPPAVCGAFSAAKANDASALRELLPNKRDLRLIAEVALMLWFAAAVHACGLVDAAAQFLSMLGMPPFVSVLVTAFAVSFITGVSLASVAISMPLAVAIAPGSSLAAFGVIAAGFLAQFVTPAHLCLVVSAQGLGASVSSLLKELTLPLVLSIAVLALLGAAVFFAAQDPGLGARL